MASLIQRRLSKAGLARQTAKGSFQTAAAFGYGVDGGSIFKLDLTENEIPLTWSNRDVLGYDRSGVKPSQSSGTVATPSLIGLLLLGVLGADTVTSNTGAITGTAVNGSATTVTLTSAPATALKSGQIVMISGVTGAGATAANGTWPITVIDTTHFTIPVTTTAAGTGGTATFNYQHLITPSPTVPYVTAFGSFGTADWVQIGDSKVSSLELSWEMAGRVSVKHEIMGCTPAFLGAAYTETNNEVLSQVGFFTAGGGTFLLNSVPLQVTGGTIKMDTHINQPVTAANVLPTDVVEGKLETTWSLKILPTDTSIFRQVYFGSGAAGALSGIASFPDLTSISAQFVGPGNDALTLASPQCRVAVEFPESNPDGGPAEMTVTGTSTLPATGSSVTATLLNAVSAY